jgi:hypothetical protein
LVRSSTFYPSFAARTGRRDRRMPQPVKRDA